MKPATRPVDLISVSLAGICFGAAGGILAAAATAILTGDPFALVLAVAPLAPLFAVLGWLLVGLPTALALRVAGLLNPSSIAVCGFACSCLLGIWIWTADSPMLPTYGAATVFGAAMTGLGAAASIRKQVLARE